MLYSPFNIKNMNWTWAFLLSTVHNIIKIFIETGEISVLKGQGHRTLLDACGLRALTPHHSSAKWAQEYFQKTLSVNTIRRAICRCQLKLYHAKRKPYVNMVQKWHRVLWAKAHLKLIVSKDCYECWKVYKGFRATSAPLQMMSISGKALYFNRTMQNRILQLLQQHGFVVEESGCWIGLPAVQIFNL